VQPVLDYGSLMPGEAADAAIRTHASALGLDPAHGVTIRLTGSVPLSDEEFASLADKAWLVAGAMIAAMLITLRVATRSWKIVSAILITTFAGLIVTTALGLAAVKEFNLISVAFIPLFVGLGVDFGIQLGVRFRAEMFDLVAHDPVRALPVEASSFSSAAEKGRASKGSARTAGVEALQRAANGLGGSLLLAACAICLGFLAFLPTDYVGISELGVIAGMGMVVALLLSVTLFPALLILFKPDRPEQEMGDPRLAPLDRFLHRKRGQVLGAFVLAMVLSIAALPLVRFDFNPLHLRNPGGEAMATLSSLMADPDRTPNTVDVLAPNLDAAKAMAARLEQLPEVQQAVTLASFVPGDQAPKLAALADARTLLDLTLDPFDIMPPPGDADLVAALGDVAPRLRAAAAKGGPAAGDGARLADVFAALAAGPPAHRAAAQAILAQPLQVLLDQMKASLQAEPVDLASLPPELRRDWIAADGRARVQVFPKGNSNDNATLARFTKAVQRIAPDASGVPVSTQAAAYTIAHAFIIAGVLALVAVSLLLLFVLRSVREVAFTLAPVVLSGFLTLGTCVIIGQPINFANIIAFPLLFGVGVAFHIYFVMAWRGGATDLLQSSLARGVFFSAIATGLAFGSLLLSSHPGTASMGRILMISLAWTLVCALIFEPALLGPQHTKRER
jgi:hopanoid biosynthesis associated RND transporter like protein HpnN